MKTITNNARFANRVSVLHLFEFDLYTLAGTFQETLYLTDHDIFVKYGGTSFTPMSISFNTLKEDISQQSNSISLTMDNVNNDFVGRAYTQEWRKNRVNIKRVVYVPSYETDGEGYSYLYGYGDNYDSATQTYPELIVEDLPFYDAYDLFTGFIDTFSATEETLSATVATKFIHWKNPFPSRTYDQREFNSVIKAMTEELHWGRA